MKILLIQIFGVLSTIIGGYLIIKGNTTDGLLLMILGELVDLPYRIAKNIINP